MHSLILGTGLATAAFTYMVAPGRAPADVKESFSGLNWAHRGLHNIDEGIPENSMAAFRAAKEQGFGVEMDLQLTADGQVVIFHDQTLERVCGVNARVDELTYDQLRTCRLLGTEERIPLFADVLALMDGQVPLLVEIKPGYHRQELCSKALELMRQYTGPLCIESFDPFVVAWFRRNAPDIIRGQLTMKMHRQERHGYGLNAMTGFAMSHVVGNFLARPHFIAHRLERRSWAVHIAEWMGAMRFAWTAHEPGSEDRYDSVIFEGYVPAPRY
jgi:glycerophosphoryl diester phosphodiesterase